MRNSPKVILSEIAEKVARGNVDEVSQAVHDALREGLDPLKIIDEGLGIGARMMGDRFANGEAFLTDLIMSGEAMKAGIQILRPEMLKKSEKASGTSVVLCTVKGDIHDIGKNIVGVMFEAAGYQVIDLGVDIGVDQMVKEIEEGKAEVLGMSALLSTTKMEQQHAIEELKRKGMRDKVKVIVGGASVSAEWAEEIGANGYADDAIIAVDMVKRLLGEINQ